MPLNEAVLRQNLDSSRKRYQTALQRSHDADSICRSVGRGHPDDMQALRNANQELSLATEQYHLSLKEFADAVLHSADQ